MTAADRPSIPRVGDILTTAEQLDALPDKAVVLDEHVEPWQKLGEGLWCGSAGGPMSGSALLRTRTDEVTVLYVPGEQPCRHCGSCDGPPSCPDCDHADRPSVTDNARVEAMQSLYDAVTTIKETGGAVEIHGVRIEPCDTYGQTETTRALDRAADRAETTTVTTDEAVGELLERMSDAVTRLEALRAEHWDASECQRLHGKVEGVKLAASYVEEARGLLATARTRPTRDEVALTILGTLARHFEVVAGQLDGINAAADAVLALYADQPTRDDISDAIEHSGIAISTSDAERATDAVLALFRGDDE